MTTSNAQVSSAWLTASTTVLYYLLVYPILLLLRALWYIVTILAIPFIYIGRVLVRLSTIPWRLFIRYEVSVPFPATQLHLHCSLKSTDCIRPFGISSVPPFSWDYSSVWSFISPYASS